MASSADPVSPPCHQRVGSKAREQGGDFFEKCDREMKRLAGELVDRANDVPPDADGIIKSRRTSSASPRRRNYEACQISKKRSGCK